MCDRTQLCVRWHGLSGNTTFLSFIFGKARFKKVTDGVDSILATARFYAGTQAAQCERDTGHEQRRQAARIV